MTVPEGSAARNVPAAVPKEVIANVVEVASVVESLGKVEAVVEVAVKYSETVSPTTLSLA